MLIRLWVWTRTSDSSKVFFNRVRQGNRCTTDSHRVWEGGRERDLDSLTENTIIASVLSSLSLSLFTVTQALTSSIHWRGRHLGLNEGPRISGAESHCHMSGWVVKDRVLFHDGGKRICVKNTEDRSKDGSLWNTEWDGSWLRGVAMDTNRLGAVRKVWREPF